MTNRPENTEPTRLDPKDAKGGVKVKGMPYVLGVSTLVAIAVLAIVFLFFV